MKRTTPSWLQGAKGIGEICSIPTAPAVQNAYYNRDGNFRTALPLEGPPQQKRKVVEVRRPGKYAGRRTFFCAGHTESAIGYTNNLKYLIRLKDKFKM